MDDQAHIALPGSRRSDDNVGRPCAKGKRFGESPPPTENFRTRGDKSSRIRGTQRREQQSRWCQLNSRHQTGQKLHPTTFPVRKQGKPDMTADRNSVRKEKRVTDRVKLEGRRI